MKKVFSKLLLSSFIISLVFDAVPVYALTKEETVYSKLDSNGNVNNVIVSEHLYDYEGNKVIDKSSLSNIKEVNGNASYSKDGDKLVWETNGSDIYYQGNSDKSLPITIFIKYYLNGNEMNVKDMVGKKGKVRIVINYKNNLKNTVLVNNRLETLYTPFVIATTSLINNTDNRNINVSNGRVIDNGLTSMIVNISSPGLYDSLGIKELEPFDHVEISYDTDNFELNTIYSVATSKVLEDSDFKVFKDISNLYSSIGLLQDNMDLIVNASKELSDGSIKLANGTNELNNKIQELYNKYSSLRDGDQEKLKKEITDIIKNNLVDVIPALEEDIVNEVNIIVHENIDDLENDLVYYSKENTKTIINNEINNALNNVSFEDLLTNIFQEDLNKVISNSNDLNNILKEEFDKEVYNIVYSTVSNTIDSLINNMNINMSDEDKYNYVNNIANKYGVTFEQAGGIISEVQNDTINGIKYNLNNSKVLITNNIINSLNNNINFNNILNNYVIEVSTRVRNEIHNDNNIYNYSNDIRENISNIIKYELTRDEVLKKYPIAKDYINNIVNNIIDSTSYDLAHKYTEDFTNQTVERVINKQFSNENIDSKLNSVLNSDKYKNELLKIDDTINKLSNAINDINNGSNLIANGNLELSNGLDKFNKEGINKLSNLVNGDFKSLEGKIEKLLELSDTYNSLDDYEDNTVIKNRYIFMIDSVKKEKEKNVNNEKIEEDKSFWDKIKGLF